VRQPGGSPTGRGERTAGGDQVWQDVRLHVGASVAAPAMLTQAVSVNPLVIDSASGLYGCAQMTVGAICTGLAGIGG
jgi:hypothetical protein